MRARAIFMSSGSCIEYHACKFQILRRQAQETFHCVCRIILHSLLLHAKELAGAIREHPASSARCDERNIKRRNRYGRTEKERQK